MPTAPARRRGERGELAAERDKDLEAECARLRKEYEEQLLLVCDLRVRENRLEQERDDASAYGRRKVRKIIDRVHEALDEAGVPREGDASYGERIRWLAARAGARPADR